MQSDKVSATIIGAGILGCAIAYELARMGLDPWILEKGPRIAEGTTSRNSGVIHAGIYYQPGSLKSESCIRGNALLYEWCLARQVPHRKTGKWIVGKKGDAAALQELYQNAVNSEARGISWHENAKDLVPAGVCTESAIFSAETGIVDPYEYTKSFRIAAEESGATFLCQTQLLAIDRLASGSYRLETSRGTVETEILINAAGLHADEVARFAGIECYQIYPWRGDYFRLRTDRHFDQLIYPVKKKGAAGLGVHLTIALDGTYRLGPDVEHGTTKEDFGNPKFLERKKAAFLEAASYYLEGLKLEDLSYDSCGIRPKLRSFTETEDKDFVLSQDLPGFINLVGIESPGLTAAIDIAQRVRQLLR
jgi:L-2-hydroxyglutarate oxidase LhgO